MAMWFLYEFMVSWWIISCRPFTFTFLTQDVNFDKIKRMVTLHYQNLTVVWDMLYASGPYFVSFRFSVYIFCFVSQFTYLVLFRFESLCFVSFLFRFSLYRDPVYTLCLSKGILMSSERERERDVSCFVLYCLVFSLY
jgi:hypothetical protein